MRLENSFTVGAPRAAVWAVLLDPSRVASCLPGATLSQVDGDSLAGTFKVSVGPVPLTYRGTAVVESDDGSHTAVIGASGRETRGSGSAQAKITCKVAAADENATELEIIVDLALTGRPAQFGRGVIGEAASKVLGQFASALDAEIAATVAAASAPQAAVEPAAVVVPPAPTEVVEVAPEAPQPLPEAPRAPQQTPANRRSSAALVFALLVLAGLVLRSYRKRRNL